jgi:hypothetical protein
MMTLRNIYLPTVSAIPFLFSSANASPCSGAYVEARGYDLCVLLASSLLDLDR